MARKDEDNYKAGVDFEWVAAKDGKGNPIKDGKGGTVKTRKFFSKSEKEAMKAPKAAPAPKPKVSKASAAPKVETKKVTATAKASGSFAPPAPAKASVKVERKPKPQSSTGGPARTTRPKFDVDYARWKAMSAAERKRLGLPTSVIGGELGFDRFLTGITGKEYKMKTK